KIFKNLPFYNTVRLKIYRYILKSTDYIEAKNNLKETFVIINEEFFDNYVKNITTPTLIIWGKDDTQTPLWMGKTLHEKIKSSKLVIIEGTHGLPLKKPVEVSEEIDNFLKV